MAMMSLLWKRCLDCWNLKKRIDLHVMGRVFLQRWIDVEVDVPTGMMRPGALTLRMCQ